MSSMPQNTCWVGRYLAKTNPWSQWNTLEVIKKFFDTIVTLKISKNGVGSPHFTLQINGFGTSIVSYTRMYP